MNLLDIINQAIQNNLSSSQLTDLRMGTVTSVSPLEISINATMDTLHESVLLLTSCVVEKKIPILQHNHVIHDTFTGSGTSEDSLSQSQIVCYEDGQPLPVSDGYIILNRALEVGDRVLLLRVRRGQKFIVLSRVFGGD